MTDLIGVRGPVVTGSYLRANMEYWHIRVTVFRLMKWMTLSLRSSLCVRSNLYLAPICAICRFPPVCSRGNKIRGLTFQVSPPPPGGRGGTKRSAKGARRWGRHLLAVDPEQTRSPVRCFQGMIGEITRLGKSSLTSLNCGIGTGSSIKGIDCESRVVGFFVIWTSGVWFSQLWVSLSVVSEVEIPPRSLDLILLPSLL